MARLTVDVESLTGEELKPYPHYMRFPNKKTVMKRYHQNLTNEVITFRTWMLAPDYVVGEDDFKWLMAFGIPIRIEKPEHTFETTAGGKHTVYGRANYTLDTTTDKQRNMLMLKYGNDIILLQEDHVLPGSISTCTLDKIVW